MFGQDGGVVGYTCAVCLLADLNEGKNVVAISQAERAVGGEGRVCGGERTRAEAWRRMKTPC